MLTHTRACQRDLTDSSAPGGVSSVRASRGLRRQDFLQDGLRARADGRDGQPRPVTGGEGSSGLQHVLWQGKEGEGRHTACDRRGEGCHMSCRMSAEEGRDGNRAAGSGLTHVVCSCQPAVPAAAAPRQDLRNGSCGHQASCYSGVQPVTWQSPMREDVDENVQQVQTPYARVVLQICNRYAYRASAVIIVFVREVHSIFYVTGSQNIKGTRCKLDEADTKCEPK